MGSRAVVVVCRDESVARERFGVVGGEAGSIYTRTGRPFFTDRSFESAMLDRIRTAMDRSNFWNDFDTSWACFDCELMPWSAKAIELLRNQFAAVGSAAKGALPEVVESMARAASQLTGIEREKIDRSTDVFSRRLARVDRYVEAYRRYCRPVETVSDFKLAPFHLMATEGTVGLARSHVDQMKAIAMICVADPDLLLPTEYRVVDLADRSSVDGAIDWWTELTERGGEGMVVKPLDFFVRGPKGPLQPAIKCRGREYLRIIYGPDYTADENLSRLRNRKLGRKRSLALGEFALGVEALERFVRREPLRRTHEAVFAVLALESEPVDPRL
jgi:protein phosphatase